MFLSTFRLNLLPSIHFSRLHHVISSSLKIEADLAYYTKKASKLFSPSKTQEETLVIIYKTVLLLYLKMEAASVCDTMVSVYHITRHNDQH
jgi:hypothetical protein